jgi:taurine dioxygenase
MLKVENLSPDLNYGSTVRGLTLSDVRDEATRRQLHDLWIDRGLVTFIDCDVTTELQVELSKVFGRLERHFQVENLVEGHEELVAFSSNPDIDGVIEVNGLPQAGYVPWHRDFHWQAQPNAGGILRVHRQPETGGDTGFIDMIDAYDTLPDRLKSKAEGVEVVCELRADDASFFRYFPRHNMVRTVMGRSYEKIAERSARGEFPPVAQPLVYTQKETGRKVLNFAPLTSVTVLGWGEREAFDFLTEIAMHVTDPARAYFHHWSRSMNDMVLWDNRRMLHLASGVLPGEDRVVWRTTIASEYALGRKLFEGGWELGHVEQEHAS